VGKHRKVRCRTPSPAWPVWVLAICHSGDAAGGRSRDVVFCCGQTRRRSRRGCQQTRDGRPTGGRQLPAGHDGIHADNCNDVNNRIFDNNFNEIYADDIFDDVFNDFPGRGYRYPPGRIDPWEPLYTCPGIDPSQ